MKFFLLIALALFIVTPMTVKAIDKVPHKFQTALVLRLMEYNQSITDKKDDIYIYVVGNPKMAKYLEKIVGKKVGKSTIKGIVQKAGVLGKEPKVIYVSDESQIKDVKQYSRKHKAMTITGSPAIVEKGVTVGFDLVNKKIKLILNLLSSEEEGIIWNPKILNFALTEESGSKKK